MSTLQFRMSVLLLIALLPSLGLAQTGLASLETISAEGTAAPVIEVFDVPAAGGYQITITDFGVPGTPVAPATGVYLLLTVAATNEVIANLSGPGASVVDLADAEHRVTLVVVPDPTQPRSSVGVSIRPVGGGTAVVDSVNVFASGDVTQNPSALEYDFDPAGAGRHEFTVVDAGFPDAFASIDAIFLDAGTGVPLAILSGPGSVELDLNAGDRVRIALVANRASDDDRSLLVVNVTEGGASVATFSARLGDWASVEERPLTIASGGLVTATVTDFALPQPVAGLTTVLLQGGLPVLGPISGTGVDSGSIPAGPALLLTAANETAVGTAGLSVTGAGAGSFLDEVVAFDGGAGATGRYASVDAVFSVSSADTFTFVVSDFRFPTAFDSVVALIAQDGTQVASLDRAGTSTIDLLPGDYSLAVIGELPQGSSGVLAVAVSASDGTTLVEEFAAGGSAIRSVSVQIAADDLLRLDLTDLVFPAAFETLNAAFTRGTDLIAIVFGGGSTTFEANAGEYVLHFVARPDGIVGHSTFAVEIGEQPRPPTITFSSDRATVPTGGDVTLSWSSQFADDCVASGGWSGTKSPAGTQTIGGLAAATEFRLTCNGPGGSADATVVVNVTAANGGGGAVQPLVLVALLLLYLIRSLRSRQAGQGDSSSRIENCDLEHIR